MADCDLFKEPMTVVPARDVVILAAPSGLAVVAMTPAAALETARLLADAARLALTDTIRPLDLDP